MSRWGKPIKNKKRRDPRYFLNESVELDEYMGLPAADDGAVRDAERVDAMVQLAKRLGVKDSAVITNWIDSPLSPEQVEQRWKEGRRGEWRALDEAVNGMPDCPPGEVFYDGTCLPRDQAAVRRKRDLERQLGERGKKRRDQAEWERRSGMLPAEDEEEYDAMDYGKQGGAMSPYHGLARFAIKATRTTEASENLSKKLALQARAARKARKSPKEIDQLEDKATAVWSGPQRALYKLELAAAKDADAQAMLDAVYEKNPKLKPGQGLSRQALSDIEEFSE